MPHDRDRLPQRKTHYPRLALRRGANDADPTFLPGNGHQMEDSNTQDNYEKTVNIIVFAIPIAVFFIVVALILGSAAGSGMLIVWLQIAAGAGAAIGGILGLTFFLNKVKFF